MDAGKLDSLLKSEVELYKSRTGKSAVLHARARACVPAGVASCYQLFDPYPFYVDESEGSNVMDVDGNLLLDFHGGYGVTLFGYRHPYIVAAASRIFSEQGFLVSLPTTSLVLAAEHLSNRYSLPFWRFLNSGTEATLDAIRLARARLDRSYIIKIESGYHGHHDGVWVSVHAGERIGKEDEVIPQVPFCSGIPASTSNLTLIAEFNNLQSVERLFAMYPDQIAGVIVEPVLLNCSMIKPKDGFLQKLIELCRKHRAAVIFDLVKINTAVGMKYITSFWEKESGFMPDMYTLGKGLSGGSCPVGAIGMSSEFAEIIESKKVQVSGTYNGNSYAIGMVLAVQTYVTEERQESLAVLSRSIRDGVAAIIAKYKLPCMVDCIGNKGCITFFKTGAQLTPVKNYQHYIQNVDLVLEQLMVYYFINRGIWVQTRDEWSVSYSHNQDHVDRFLILFDEFAQTVSSL
jgi:glutamate-1-semialdehyde 2,1-aminomutase